MDSYEMIQIHRQEMLSRFEIIYPDWLKIMRTTLLIQRKLSRHSFPDVFPRIKEIVDDPSDQEALWQAVMNYWLEYLETVNKHE